VEEAVTRKEAKRWEGGKKKKGKKGKKRKSSPYKKL
jgi:hypothetical protein